MKPCPFCAEPIQEAAVVCRYCQRNLTTGALPTSAVTAPPSPSAGVAAVLSLIIPGAGQMYKGHVGVGLAWLVGVVLGYLLLILPGIVLHLVCILQAASVASAVPPAPRRLPTADELAHVRVVQRQQWKRGLLLLAVFIVFFFASMIPVWWRASGERAATRAAVENALGPVTQIVETARGALTVPGDARVEGSGRLPIAAYAGEPEVRCTLASGSRVRVRAVQTRSERRYFRITSGDCTGWVTENVLRPR